MSPLGCSANTKRLRRAPLLPILNDTDILPSAPHILSWPSPLFFLRMNLLISKNSQLEFLRHTKIPIFWYLFRYHTIPFKRIPSARAHQTRLPLTTDRALPSLVRTLLSPITPCFAPLLLFIPPAPDDLASCLRFYSYRSTSSRPAPTRLVACHALYPTPCPLGSSPHPLRPSPSPSTQRIAQ